MLVLEYFLRGKAFWGEQQARSPALHCTKEGVERYYQKPRYPAEVVQTRSRQSLCDRKTCFLEEALGWGEAVRLDCRPTASFAVNWDAK